ncbi:MAG: MBL fold metallo-hydrolase, partial [Armatimonadetes bacterium]|nr:MBL fold metallo-hydrolase [Armatimonadota bacterium]
IFFALMVGTGPSVSRALIMAVLALAAGVFDLDYDPYTALSLAAALICAADPLALFSIGMQLSFGATLGVLIALRSLPERLRRRSLWLRVPVGTAAGSAGAWLIVTPLLAYHFHAFPIVGGLANLVALPAAALAMVLTQTAVILSFVHEAAGAIPLHPARWMVDAIVRVNDWCRALPGAYVDATHFSASTCALWYAALACVACAYRARLDWRPRLTPRQWVGVVLAVGVATSLWFALGAYQPDRLTVTFLDVGHGQCCLLETTAGRAMLVDAGSGYTLSAGDRCARDVILPYLRTRGIKRLEAIVITHPDADHLNAVPAILGALEVGVLLESFPAAGSSIYGGVRRAAQAAGVPVKMAAAGGVLHLGGDVRAEVLWPTGTESDRAFEDNDRSVVLRLTHRQVAMLLPADIGLEAEEELLKRGAPLAADVLQAPHHGSGESSSWAFVQAVSPSVAVVSCQAADPAHPAPVVEARLRDVGAELWRTDQAGAVTIVSDGRSVAVRGHARRRAQGLGLRAASSASSSGSGSAFACASASSASFGRRASTIR